MCISGGYHPGRVGEEAVGCWPEGPGSGSTIAVGRSDEAMRPSPAMGFLILTGTLQTITNAWPAFSIHDYASELFSTRIRARAVAVVYSWGRSGGIFTRLFVAATYGHHGIAGVFIFIAAAMLIGGLSIALLGLRANGRALEEIFQ